ncbi:hypothetical protein ES703_84004 [subsurface metagenome]
MAFSSLRNSSGSFQSFHIPSRIDCSVWMAEYSNTLCLHFLTNSATPYPSISLLDVKPSAFSTSTSIQSPWQSNPFWFRTLYPLMDLYLGQRSLYVLPHAWCTPMGLFAVMGPSMKDQPGKSFVSSTRFLKAPIFSQKTSVSRSSLAKSDFVSICS